MGVREAEGAVVRPLLTSFDDILGAEWCVPRKVRARVLIWILP